MGFIKKILVLIKNIDKLWDMFLTLENLKEKIADLIVELEKLKKELEKKEGAR